MDALALVKTLLRIAYVTATMDDTGQFPKIQVGYLGKTGDASVWFPFGFHASPDLETVCVIAAMQGNPDSRVAFPGNQDNRPALERGEVVLFHPATGSKVHMKAGGDIEVVSTTKVLIDAPAAQFTGDVEVDGDLDVAGATALSATVTANSKDISDTHSHIGSPTAPLGVVSNTGVPI
jgi:phage gp45-like